MWQDNRGWIVSVDKELLWIMGSFLARNNSLGLKRFNDRLVFLQTRSFSIHKTLTDGLNVVDYLWIIVMFLSAVWTLILMAPIHLRWSIGK